MSVSVWLRTSVPVAVEAKSLAIAASCAKASLALQLPLGMAGHNIIDTLMPDGFAGKRVMSAAIDYFCGLPARPGKPDHKSHQNDGKQQTDRDDDGQTVLKMNLVLDDEVIPRQGRASCLVSQRQYGRGLSIGYVWTGPKPWKPCARTHGTCVRWNPDRITVEPQRFSSWRMDAARYSRCVRTCPAVFPLRRNAGTRRFPAPSSTTRAWLTSNGLMVATSMSTIGCVLAIVRMALK